MIKLGYLKIKSRTSSLTLLTRGFITDIRCKLSFIAEFGGAFSELSFSPSFFAAKFIAPVELWLHWILRLIIFGKDVASENIEVNNFAQYNSLGERALSDICSLPSQLNLLTTFTPLCAPSKFFNSRTQALKLYFVTSSAHTLVASCLFLGGEVWITVKNTKGELTSDENCRIRALHIISIGPRGKIIKIAFVGGMSVLKLTFHQQTNCLFAFWSILQP